MKMKKNETTVLKAVVEFAQRYGVDEGRACALVQSGLQNRFCYVREVNVLAASRRCVKLPAIEIVYSRGSKRQRSAIFFLDEIQTSKGSVRTICREHVAGWEASAREVSLRAMEKLFQRVNFIVP